MTEVDRVSAFSGIRLTIRRCATCGIFEPQELGYLSKIVAMPCAHGNWQEVEYVPVDKPAEEAVREQCPDCEGSGWLGHAAGDGQATYDSERCPTCRGSGFSGPPPRDACR